MKCEYCGKRISINWGDGHVVLCEKHSNQAKLLAAPKKKEHQVVVEQYKAELQKEYEEENSIEVLKWRMYVSPVIFGLLFISGFSGTLYWPGPGGFIHKSDDPGMYWGFMVLSLIGACYSFYNGYTGLKKRQNI